MDSLEDRISGQAGQLSSSPLLSDDPTTKQFHIYKDYTHVLEACARNRPLSAVCLDNGHIGFVLRPGRTQDTSFLRWQIDETSDVVVRNGFRYFSWDTPATSNHRIPFEAARVSHYILLLPQLGKSGLVSSPANVRRYCAITSEWLTLVSQQEGFRRAPTVSWCDIQHLSQPCAR